jgi:hypothetical protein
VGAVLAALLAVKLFAPATDERRSREAEVGQLVDSYLGARAGGRAEEACRHLTEDAQRDLARLVGGFPVGTASPQDCPRYVLQTSTASIYTFPGVEQLAAAERDFKHWLGGGVTVNPAGRVEPDLHARREDGRWKLDGLTPWRGTFVTRCEEGGESPAYCECLFHELRIRGYGAMRDTNALLQQRAAGEMPAPLVDSAQACVHAAA